MSTDDFTLAECAVVVRWLRDVSLLNVIRNWLKAKRRAKWERLLDGKEGRGATIPSDAMKDLALAAVMWDGASEDGCAFCGEGYDGDDPLVLHDSACPVVAHRLELITQLVAMDPAPDTPEGERLGELALAQEKYEKRVLDGKEGGPNERD